MSIIPRFKKGDRYMEFRRQRIQFRREAKGFSRMLKSHAAVWESLACSWRKRAPGGLSSMKIIKWKDCNVSDLPHCSPFPFPAGDD